MKLIVWLGNPGREYAGHRHTIGFVVVDKFVGQWWGKWVIKKERWCAIAECVVDGQKVIVMMPILYMNRSGGPVQQVANFYKITPENILVIHDEIDFETARLALKKWGSAAGHNGLKDIIAKLDTKDFWRLRIGVDRPAADSSQSVADYVLQNFSKTDLTAILDKWEMMENMVGDFLIQK